MFLSRLTLDLGHPQARRDLSNPYDMHRTLARAYAADFGLLLPRILWRLEPNSITAPSAVLLVQSDVPADWSALDALPGYALEILGNKPINLEKLIVTGGHYHFRLLANPTVTRLGKRRGLVREEDQRAWLARQGEKGGFAVVACIRRSNERIRARQGRGGRRITVQGALFEGMLEVTDAGLLRLAVCNGLGHGKAWGLGLLSLARIG